MEWPPVLNRVATATASAPVGWRPASDAGSLFRLAAGRRSRWAAGWLSGSVAVRPFPLAAG
jgi:hypothetical protein